MGQGAAGLVPDLVAAVGRSHVLTDPGDTAPYTTDWTGRFGAAAAAVVRPADTAQVRAVLAACARAGVPVVVQGGNTGLVGGGVPAGGEVLLSTTRMTGVAAVARSAGTAYVTVRAGTTLAQVQDAIRPDGLDVGVDLAARGTATVAGMVATNAGGEHVLRHGSMGEQVAGLEAVLADGQVIGRLTRPAKDNTGYDLDRLLVGSEGTLAVITGVRLRLVAAPSRLAVALVGVASVQDAVHLLDSVRPQLTGLASAELMTAGGVALVRAHAGLPDPMADPHPVYVLLECAAPAAGPSPQEELTAALGSVGGFDDAVVAADRRARDQLRRYREDHSEAVAAAGRPVKLDVCLPVEALAPFTDQLDGTVAASTASDTDARIVLFGHLAEGNLHINILGVAPQDTDRVTAAILQAVAVAGGSISAEHGVGRAKVAWLHLSRSSADIAAMTAVKRALDPSGLLGPGVLLPEARAHQ